jgi:CheY-like chemotaxis protein
MGIAPEVLPRVFDVFAQEDRALKHSQDGLGIGLSLVQGLVQLHGGTVEAQSAGEGQGSEFVVRLPARGECLQPRKARSKSTVRGGCSLRVLIVDDNYDAAHMLAKLLETAGHEVLTALDGPSALEGASAYRPQVVLLDIKLPGIDGYEVARRIRRLPELENLLLVALTGYGQEEDHWRSRQAGFEHHLVKPVDVEELERLLSQYATAIGLGIGENRGHFQS